MTLAVFKYPFNVDDDNPGVVLPRGAIWEHLDRDPAFPEGSGRLAVWALVDPHETPLVPIALHVVGTGHPAPDLTEGRHRGSVIDGPFVWHVFEIPAPAADPRTKD